MALIKQVNTPVAILGGGPAGYLAALTAARLGTTSVIIEERQIGGTCLNRGCIPTKALLKTAETAYLINKSKEFGINSSISSLDFKTVSTRKDRVVKNLRMGLEHLLLDQKVQILRGKGKIDNPRRLSVISESGEEVMINCAKLIIATGSAPLIPDIPGLKLDKVITSDEALELTQISEDIVIIGAGAIGLEFACLFNSLGSRVTVLEAQDRILPQEDDEISSELLKIMKRQGIKFKLVSQVKKVRKSEKGLKVLLAEDKTEDKAIDTLQVLVAVGRRLRISDAASLGLELSKGAIAVDEHMQTKIPGVYAAGDVIGGKLLAHLAFAEGRVAMQNALGLTSSLNYDAVPSCVYTNPEICSVGLSEQEANSRGLEIRAGRFEFRKNGRALCLGERAGLVKVIADKKTGVILGGQILGAYASELISEITLAVSLRVKAKLLAEMIHPHPSLSEAVMEACAEASGGMQK